MMDITVFEHLLIAVSLYQLCLFLPSNISLIVSISFAFILREITQAEYRWIEKFGQGKRANLPWWGAFDYRVWDIHSMLDWIVPSIGLTVIVLMR